MWDMSDSFTNQHHDHDFYNTRAQVTHGAAIATSRDQGLPHLSDSTGEMSIFDSVSAIAEGGKGPSEQHLLLRVALE